MKTDIKFLKFGMKKESPVEEKNKLISEIQKTNIKGEKLQPFNLFYFILLSDRIHSEIKATNLNL